MTAEVVVMNKTAVALAADSAASIRTAHGVKVYAANKLFRLSPSLPVGVLVYGSSEFMGVPWEVLIREFRAGFGSKSLRHLKDYAVKFMQFLKRQSWLQDEGYSRLVAASEMSNYLDWLVRDLDRQLQQDFAQGSPPAGDDAGKQHTLEELLKAKFDELGKVALDRVRRERDRLSQFPKFDELSEEAEKKIHQDFSEDVRTIVGRILAASAILKLVPPQEELQEALCRAALFPLTRQPPTELSSGLVFAGYGRDDVFPSTHAMSFRGILAGSLQKKVDEHRSLGISRENSATVIGFAQDDMIGTFMHGADPSLQNRWWETFRKFVEKIPDTVSQALQGSAVVGADTIVEALRAYLSQAGEALLSEAQQAQREDHTIPFIQSVSFLSKDEMAELAESLIRLTSLKRRVTMTEETVGGPIDVAVISRGEGFVYVKRKHYFDRKLNPYYGQKSPEPTHEPKKRKKTERTASTAKGRHARPRKRKQAD
ncbi:MAG: hypothetical protein KDB82_06270 [Planctomycetes bacterium]|nr:hypothetical protein [Planctomycetota bacterium]